MSTTTPLGFIVPVDADAPNGPLEIGGNAETADALLQKGGVAGHFESHGAALTRASTTMGAFSTPVLITLPKVKAGQIVEIVCRGFIKSTIETKNLTQGISAALLVGAAGVASSPVITLAANTFHFFEAVSTVLQIGAETATPESQLGKSLAVGMSRLIIAAEATNVAVELQGASLSSGTITVEDVYLAAHVWG